MHREHPIDTAHHAQCSMALRSTIMVLVRHHIKYEEIHGEDVVVLITQSEHRKIHSRLRKEKKCNVPVEVLRRISQKAYYRGNKKERNEVSYACKLRRNDYREKHNAINRSYYNRHRESENLRKRLWQIMYRTSASKLRPDIISKAFLFALSN